MKLPSDKCHWVVLMISQHWFRLWLSAVWQQAIIWVSVDPDLCFHLAPLGINEVTEPMLANILTTVLPGTNLSEFSIKHTHFHSRKCMSKLIVCKMAVILSPPQLCSTLWYAVCFFKARCQCHDCWLSRSDMIITDLLEYSFLSFCYYLSDRHSHHVYITFYLWSTNRWNGNFLYNNFYLK